MVIGFLRVVALLTIRVLAFSNLSAFVGTYLLFGDRDTERSYLFQGKRLSPDFVDGVDGNGDVTEEEEGESENETDGAIHSRSKKVTLILPVVQYYVTSSIHK